MGKRRDKAVAILATLLGKEAVAALVPDRHRERDGPNVKSWNVRPSDPRAKPVGLLPKRSPHGAQRTGSINESTTTHLYSSKGFFRDAKRSASIQRGGSLLPTR
jgi:hypothetical protein